MIFFRPLLTTLLLLFVATPAWSQTAQEFDLYGTSSSTQRMRIELESFVIDGLGPSAPEWVRALDDRLQRDLDNSDLFEIARWYQYPGEPAYANSVALVRATVARQGPTWILTGRVLSLPTLSPIFERTYAFPEARAGASVHEFADDIVNRLTGQIGIASTTIAYYQAADSGGKELWIIDADGENARQLTFDGSLNLSPSWSADGTRLVHTTYASGRPQLAILELATGKRRILNTGEGLNTAAAFAPNGSQLAFARATEGDTDIYRIGVDGSNLTQLTQVRGIDTAPTWSPTGLRMAFVSDRAGSPQIYVMDRNGGGARRLTFAGSYNGAPEWSPIGDRIVFVSKDDRFMNLYTMTADGRELRPVVYARGECEGPTWAPDGRHVVYSALRDGARRLYVIDVETGRERALTDGRRDCYGPAWSPVSRSETTAATPMRRSVGPSGEASSDERAG